MSFSTTKDKKEYKALLKEGQYGLLTKKHGWELFLTLLNEEIVQEYNNEKITIQHVPWCTI